MKEVFFYFLKLGATGFGGPLALVAIMQKELAEQRKWVSPQQFQKAFALIKAMPGPIAFSSAVYFGRERGGFWGGTLAGIGMILPAFLLMVAFGVLTTATHDVQWIQKALWGMQISALALILQSVRGLARGYEKIPVFYLLGLVGLVLGTLFPQWEPLVIVGSGLIAIAALKRPKGTALFAMGLLSLPVVSWAQSYLDLSWISFKSGAFVFGSGIAIVPMLKSEVVTHMKWLTDQEFLNAVALGQVTPGPVVITATYIGYKVLGLGGACVATFMIFLPSYIHMMTWFPRAVRWLETAPWIQPFVTGAIGAVTGVILSAVLKLGQALEWNLTMGAIFVGSFFLVQTKKLPVWSVIPISGVVSLIF